ncbi:MAG TPA: PrsW family glutamic-type intramembrane protease [Mycobacterium sp.]
MVQPRRAAFWVFVVLLLFGGTAVLADEYHGFAVTATAHLTLLPVWLLFAAASVRLILLFDPFRSMRRHWTILIAAAALGATWANAMAIYGNARAGRWFGQVLGLTPSAEARWQAAFVAPLVEEVAKAVCVAVVLALSAPVLNRIAHAMMIGMFTGFGFLMAENLNLATISGLDDPHSSRHGIVQSMSYRLPTILSSHWCYTGLTAVALLLLMPWFAERANWSRRRRLGTASALVIAALLMHGLWNLPQPEWMGLAVADAAKIAVNTVILLTATLPLLRVERRRVRSEVSAQRRVALAGFDQAVLDSLPTYRQRSALRLRGLRESGLSATHSVRGAQCRALDTIQAGTDHMSRPMSSTRTECVSAPTAR